MGQKIKPQVSLFLCTFQPRRGQVPSPSCGTSLHQCPPPLVSGSLLAPFPCKQAHVSLSKTINKIFPLLFPAPLPRSAAHFSREHPRPSPPSHPPLLGPWQPWVPGKAAPGWPIGFSSSWPPSGVWCPPWARLLEQGCGPLNPDLPGCSVWVSSCLPPLPGSLPPGMSPWTFSTSLSWPGCPAVPCPDSQWEQGCSKGD